MSRRSWSPLILILSRYKGCQQWANQTLSRKVKLNSSGNVPDGQVRLVSSLKSMLERHIYDGKHSADSMVSDDCDKPYCPIKIVLLSHWIDPFKAEGGRSNFCMSSGIRFVDKGLSCAAVSPHLFMFCFDVDTNINLEILCSLKGLSRGPIKYTEAQSRPVQESIEYLWTW